jgi:TRAP-type C4-dicarboxylate transport system permease small subunit
MTIGGSIALIVIGAILRFAINWSPSSHVNLSLIGVILMIGGAIGLIISVSFLAARRRRTVAPPPAPDVYEERRRRTVAPPPDADVYEERRYTQSPGSYNDPPL